MALAGMLFEDSPRRHLFLAALVPTGLPRRLDDVLVFALLLGPHPADMAVSRHAAPPLSAVPAWPGGTSAATRPLSVPRTVPSLHMQSSALAPPPQTADTRTRRSAIAIRSYHP